MKDSKKYTDNLTKYWKSNKPKKKPQKPEYPDCIDALVYACILEKFSSSAADKCLKKLAAHFVDWNDLRISRDEEIVEVLAGDKAKNYELSVSLRNSLQALFEKNDCLQLNYIIELGKRNAKEELDSFGVLSSFVISYIMLICLDAHSIPFNEQMVDFFKANDLADENESPEKIQGFVERVIPATDNYLFFDTLLDLSGKGSTKSKKTTTKKTKKKTNKK